MLGVIIGNSTDGFGSGMIKSAVWAFSVNLPEE
jgi:hypothetical protein